MVQKWTMYYGAFEVEYDLDLALLYMKCFVDLVVPWDCRSLSRG